MTGPDGPPETPHRRYDPLADRWVLVSASRGERPWLGLVEEEPAAARAAYDPDCYLCPGNVRAGGTRNPTYEGTHVFTNDFAALRPDVPEARSVDGLLRVEGERGTCRVVCYSPRHDVDLGRMERDDVRGVIDVWASESDELGRTYRWVQVFENRGPGMGASNPHPHGQIWAGTALPEVAAREDASQRRHFAATGRSLLGDYLGQEAGGPRVVHDAGDWLVVVPFWAAWPFETLILPKRPARRLGDLDGPARDALAGGLIALLAAYDRLFERPFPYSMGWHGAPHGGEAGEHWLLHAHVYSDALRASVRKFMVGYELLAEVQRDLTPEDAAARLRAVPIR